VAEQPDAAREGQRGAARDARRGTAGGDRRGAAGEGGAGSREAGAQRADARRNRARILAVAIDAFAREGLGVSVQEIARRAAVSTGTVSRHFPAKDDLYAAIVLDRAESLVATARALAASEPPGPAFYRFIDVMAMEGARNRAIGDALAGAGFDIQAAAGRADQDLMAMWQSLLAGAQAAREVRADLTVDDVKVLVMSCCKAGNGPDANQADTRRLLSVVAAGLRPEERSAT
jgi:AcrR family transcriptional regulator